MKTCTRILLFGWLLPTVCLAQFELKKGDSLITGHDGQGNVTNMPVNGRSFTPEEREEWLSGLGGIGVVIDVQKEGVRIKEVIADTPAAAAALQPGDVILEIDDHSAGELTTKDALKRLRGKPGSIANLKIRRAVDGNVYTLRVRREIIRLPHNSKPDMKQPPSNPSVQSTPTRADGAAGRD